MINIKRMITALIGAIILFYILRFIFKTVLLLLIIIPIVLVAFYIYYRFITPNKIKAIKKDNIEEMEFEELD